jgi:N-acetyl-alpha-D-muramate 1-phosphate uridylyltransferase
MANTAFGVRRAMILAAGLGKRMRPITASIPKPLVEVRGKALIDHILDRLKASGVETAVVNVHHLADQIERHLRRRTRPQVVISDERVRLLGTGGGIAQALFHFRGEPFLVLNGDSFWIEGTMPNLTWLSRAFDPLRMDGLILLAPTATSIGYDGRGDFVLAPEGLVRRRKEREVAPFVYSGVTLVHPRLFDDAPPPPFSLNLMFDRAIEADRLFGMRMDGIWMHVGTPEAIRAAELSIAASAA